LLLYHVKEEEGTMVTKAEEGDIKIEAAEEEVGGLVISKKSSGIDFRAPEPRTSTLGESILRAEERECIYHILSPFRIFSHALC